MTTRRTFIQRLASTVAAIALAPALCRGMGRLEVEQEVSKAPVNMAFPHGMGYCASFFVIEPSTPTTQK